MNGKRSSRAEDTARVSLRLGLGLLLLFPYLIWLAEISDWSRPSAHEILSPMFSATVQALCSALFAMGLGLLMFLGLQACRRRGFTEAALLLPNAIPPLFLAMALLTLISPWMAFPFGFDAVIVAHVLLQSGLVAVAIDRVVQVKVGGMAESAWVLGVGASAFWREVAIPQIRGDLYAIFLFVFSLCFTSFSIPLLLSGSERGLTLEIAIFDMIREQGKWDKAVILAAVQSFMLLLFAWILPRPLWPSRPSRASLQILAVPLLKPLIFLPAVILISGWSLGIAGSFREGIEPYVQDALPTAVLLTAAIGLAVGLSHLLLFLVTAFVLPHERLDRFLNGYLAPSPTIAGFGLLLIPLSSEGANFLKVIAALTLISYPLLYRWIVHSALAALQNQIVIARSLGASWSAVLFEIVWPQAGGAILRACGLAAVWACGDFAISGLLLGQETSLPMLMEDLLGNYRFEQAALLLIPLVIISLLVYALFVRAARYVAS